ncbi:immunity 51 family protein [Chryseobacterium indologenes]|uniref:immunity 51 family protein n=1 Tax=Chryseobacterium TaxID=59732 RepID=UPI0016238A59|nr:MULTISPECIES: immunity 51 family protein [Chryseobacterium]MDM1555185.1 immunity 51 family protein [Chryseobacterium indologenes]WET49745.1 immunity 51 family protein [Chryseobacterium indologenes]
MDIDYFKETIKPFFWVQHANSFSVGLDVGGYKQEIFNARADEGFEGSGYDWGSLAQVFLDEKRPDLADGIRFDPEGGMFCAYSSEENKLKDFILDFKKACEDEVLIKDLFSRAQLD